LHQVDVAARPERVAPIADDITSPREGETSRRSSPRGSTTWLGLRRATYVVVALAMTLTLVTALLIRHVNADSERRQLHQRTHEASVVLESLIGTIEGPMQIGGQAFDALGPQQQVFDLLAENATGKDQIVAGAAIVQVAPPASAANPRIFMRTSGPLALAAPGAARAIGRVRGDLLVADVDELDAALRHCREHGNVRVAAQAENVADTAALQVAHEMIGNCVFHEAVRVTASRCCRTRRTVPGPKAGPRESDG
jgi:hypothetical protein